MRGGAAPALLVLVWSRLGAQVSGSLNLSASDIRYDLFEPSTALSLSPTITYDQGWTSVAARGTLLRFQSGHQDLHGSLVATTFLPVVGRFRVETGVDAGVSRYRSLPSFSHALAAVDLHYLLPHYGAWLGGTGGSTSFGGTGVGATTLGAGVWASNAWATLTLTGSHSAIGDTSYTDFQGTARITQGPLELDGQLGARLGSKGGGHGVFGEASLTFAVTRVIGLLIGGGRYPTDPMRGTIAGRYASIGIELGIHRARPVQYSNTSPADLELDGRVLRIRVQGASRVEVMGDFSDWAPVVLTRGGIALTPGPHLLEMRVDGGPWMAPPGATVVKDEFGGEAGLIVVP